jgi:ribosomal protein S12 methylthiotransferase
MCTTQKLNLARVQRWLEANGASVVDDVDAADRLLCMTCNGWSLLEQNSYDRINKYKDSFKGEMIVMGCIVDAHPGKVKEMFDGPVVGTKGDKPYSFADIEALFPDFEIKLADVPAQSVFRRKEDYRDLNLSKRFINIAEGCAFSCTFCTHKPGLGNRRSRPLDDIMMQIEQCVREDVKIINLMGMETSLYGIDVGSSYPELLRAVLEYDESYQVHVAQFQPQGIYRYYDDLLELFKNKRVTDIQVPIQSVSARVMKMMNRRELSQYVGPFMKEVRAVNTRAILRTDVIIGWPTETEEERLASLDFAGQHFDEVALYSIELHPDLPAWKYAADAFSPEELVRIRRESVAYMSDKYGIVVHSGQQEDNMMKDAEQKRMKLRELRAAS